MSPKQPEEPTVDSESVRPVGSGLAEDPEPAVEPETPAETQQRDQVADASATKATPPIASEEPEQPAAEPAPFPSFFKNEDSLETAGFLIRRARREMKRARLESASEQYSLAEKILSVGAEEAKLTQQIADGRAMIEHLDGFWKQVVKSSRTYDGDDLSPAPGVTVGFVEGRPNDVVLKIGGQVVGIPYRSLRPGLAMVLASQMADASSADWLMQQAAFRIVHSNGTGRSSSKIETQLAEAAESGQSTKQLRDFWKVANAAPSSEDNKVTIRDSQLRPFVEKLTAKKYPSLSRVSPQMASKFATELTSMPYGEPQMRIAALDESIKLVTKSGDAWLMLDLVDELDRWSKIDAPDMKSDAFQKMSRLRDPEVVRNIGDAFFEFIKSPDAEDLNPNRMLKVKKMMLEFTHRNEMIDIERLINQTLN